MTHLRHVRRVGGAALLVTASACATAIGAATMVQPPAAALTENAPANASEWPGIVRYLNEGVGTIREHRRKDAYRQMADACHGAYRITAEGEQMEGHTVIASRIGETATMTSSTPTHYWYIQFRCGAK